METIYVYICNQNASPGKKKYDKHENHQEPIFVLSLGAMQEIQQHQMVIIGKHIQDNSEEVIFFFVLCYFQIYWDRGMSH